jgi:hypothetical protein
MHRNKLEGLLDTAGSINGGGASPSSASPSRLRTPALTCFHGHTGDTPALPGSRVQEPTLLSTGVCTHSGRELPVEGKEGAVWLVLVGLLLCAQLCVAPLHKPQFQLQPTCCFCYCRWLAGLLRLQLQHKEKQSFDASDPELAPVIRSAAAKLQRIPTKNVCCVHVSCRGSVPLGTCLHGLFPHSLCSGCRPMHWHVCVSVCS